MTLPTMLPHGRDEVVAWCGRVDEGPWASLAVRPLLRRRWSRAAVAAYPVLMVFAIVVSANHYFLDAVGGVVALSIGYALASWRDAEGSPPPISV